MSTVKFGIAVGAYSAGVPSGRELADFARTAEAVGFDSVQVGDHIQWHAPIIESTVLLATFAAVTTRVRIASDVVILPLRDPVLIAKTVASLDVLSGGRMIFGVGVGGDHPGEYAAMRVPLAERGARANESLEIVRGLWTNERFSYAGRHFTIDDVADSLVRKLNNRAPSVLAGESISLDEQLAQWEERKADEKRNKGAVSAMDDVPTGQPALALTQKVFQRVIAAGLPVDLIPDAMTSIVLSLGDDAENTLRSATLEFMDTVRKVEHAVAASRRPDDVPEVLDIAQLGVVTEEEWRAHWPTAVPEVEPEPDAETVESEEPVDTEEPEQSEASEDSEEPEASDETEDSEEAADEPEQADQEKSVEPQ